MGKIIETYGNAFYTFDGDALSKMLGTEYGLEKRASVSIVGRVDYKSGIEHRYMLVFTDNPNLIKEGKKTVIVSDTEVVKVEIYERYGRFISDMEYKFSKDGELLKKTAELIISSRQEENVKEFIAGFDAIKKQIPLYEKVVIELLIEEMQQQKTVEEESIIEEIDDIDPGTMVEEIGTQNNIDPTASQDASAASLDAMVTDLQTHMEIGQWADRIDKSISREDLRNVDLSIKGWAEGRELTDSQTAIIKALLAVTEMSDSAMQMAEASTSMQEAVSLFEQMSSWSQRSLEKKSDKAALRREIADYVSANLVPKKMRPIIAVIVEKCQPNTSVTLKWVEADDDTIEVTP